MIFIRKVKFKMLGCNRKQVEGNRDKRPVTLRSSDRSPAILAESINPRHDSNSNLGIFNRVVGWFRSSAVTEAAY